MQELEKILEEIEAEFDRRIDIQLKIMAGLGDDVYRYGYGKSLEAYQQGKLFVEDIIRKHMNDGWIPVEERLPEGRTRVICQFDNGDIELLWQDWESDTESLTYWTDFDFMAEKKVIAWRHLPEPYRPERSEE